MYSKILLAAFAILGLAGCKQEFNGNLNVGTQITLVSKKSQQVPIRPGNYSTKLQISGKNKMDLILQTNVGDIQFPFKTSQNLKNITPGSQIFVSSRESGQPYNINALYNASVSNSQTYREVESCIYYRNEYRCETIYIPPSCQVYNDCSRGTCVPRQVCTPGRHEQRCGYFSVPYNGYSDVEYYIATTTTTVNGNLQHPSNNANVAGFQVSDQESMKKYTFQGLCH